MRLRATAALTVLAALALSACGISMTPSDKPTTSAPTSSETTAPATPLDQLDFLADPSNYQGPSTATLHIDGLQAPASAPAQSLPVTVTSHDRSGDQMVTVTDTSRIVAVDIAGSIGDTIWALGLSDLVVGRDVAASFPGSEDVPVVTGNGHSISAEAVLALGPTIVITDGSVGPTSAIDQLRDVGVTVVYVDNVSSFDGAAQLARDVAHVLGVPDAGETVAQSLTEQVDQVRAQIAQIAPAEGDKLRMVFLYLRGSASVYYLFGAESGADQLIAALGGVDAAAETGIKGTQPLTDEAMLAADPDVLLVMTDGIESVGGVDGLTETWPAIALTTAGKNKRVVDMADTLILSFGPKSAAVLDGLARAIYAPDAP
ncbi:heme/hemin ABC transporter substrate-binding protein [Demequina sp.]|uniref:heme/hemin ABC transporter substrate-binding protein n=1 Tax=Demequina sp. TaxID=2050685 RepID=UPI003D0EDFF2